MPCVGATPYPAFKKACKISMLFEGEKEVRSRICGYVGNFDLNKKTLGFAEVVQRAVENVVRASGR
ncbi:MAG: hypothetical protein N2448_06035 [Caloramator sp.]|nr:hypothetical protein [Caloramator sp.]